MPKYLLVIGGPTASGKTALAIELSRQLSAPVLSADSRQFYRELRIGVARPTEEELTLAPHHFIADRSVAEPLSAGAFAREALALLEQLYREHDYAILVGGSGLYVRALTEGLDEFPPVSDEIKLEVEELFAHEGLAGLQSALAEADPDYYAEVDQRNPARLQRALAVCRASGRPYSSFRQAAAPVRPFIPVYVQLSWLREDLYARIDARVGRMMGEGLLEEARSALSFRDQPALQTVGYQELFDYLDGKTDLPTAVELIKRNSRRYAKRQLTWHRRDGYWKHVRAGDLRAAMAYLQLVREQGLTCTGEIHLAAKNKSSLRVSLVKDKNMMAHADLEVRATFALLTRFRTEGLDHLARAVLLHQALHLAERPVVYADTETVGQRDFLLSQGFRELPEPVEEAELVWEWRQASW
ncbi:MAG: tRNA (adenosine(37)-N6)-dimethylallyltransferase MiaA [Lewinella sp.]|nr:tRNA (adenosine(37)-N6)-dimethylallyltransferase MiaA [Lewinella sp.]